MVSNKLSLLKLTNLKPSIVENSCWIYPNGPQGSIVEKPLVVLDVWFGFFLAFFVKWCSLNEIQSNSKVYSSFASIYINTVIN